MLTTIALDDERPALDIITAFSRRESELDLLGTFTSVTAARRLLVERSVDLVFLDINMPAISGLDLARELPDDTQVIFTTSYSEFALESYEVRATDYLLKPFTPERFGQAVSRAVEVAAGRRAHPEPLLLKSGYDLERIFPSDIRYVEALDNYLRIHRIGVKPVTIRMTMKELMARLPAADFARIHRSYLVRLKAVSAVRGRTVFVDQHSLPLGSSHAAKFLRRIAE